MVRQQLEALKIGDRPPERTSSLRMILPGHLNDLLDIALPGQVLLIDLRTDSDFQRSHVQGAVNLRAPAAFLRHASLDLIEQAFADDQSRRTFSNWQFAKCIVFYSRGLESTSDCRAADALLPRFRAWGWDGEVYLLKGHYREFGASFSKHIEGTRMTEEAKEHIENLRKKPASKQDRAKADALYRNWLAERQAEERTLGSGGSPTVDDERRDSLERQEQNLDEEFQAKFPDLYRQAQEMYEPGGIMMRRYPHQQEVHRKDDSISDAKAQMVEYLDRGLTKMRDGGKTIPRPATTASVPMRAPGRSKLQDLQYYDGSSALPAAGDNTRRDRRSSDDYVEINKGDAGESILGKVGYSGEPEGALTGDRPKRGRGGGAGGGNGGILNRVWRRG